MNVNTGSCGVCPMDFNAVSGTEKDMCRVIWTMFFLNQEKPEENEMFLQNVMHV